MSERDISPELQRALDRINSAVQQFFPRQARYSYWEANGHLFCYSTESVQDGKFESWDYVPYGPGARTNPTRWKPRNRVQHTLRRQAKARAYSRYVKAKGATS